MTMAGRGFGAFHLCWPLKHALCSRTKVRQAKSFSSYSFFPTLNRKYYLHPQSDRHFAIKNKLFIVTDALHTYGETIAETNKRSIFFRRKVHQWTQHTAGQSTVTDLYLFCNFRALKPAANAEITSLWFQRLKNSIYQSELFMIMLYEYVTYSWRISRVQVRGLKARLLLCHRILRSRKYSYCENKTTSIIEEIYWKKFDLKHMKKERKKYAAQHTVSVHLNKS